MRSAWKGLDWEKESSRRGRWGEFLKCFSLSVIIAVMFYAGIFTFTYLELSGLLESGFLFPSTS